MVRIYPFRAVRPLRAHAQSIVAVPYDVVSLEDARACISENPLSFLRVSRADAELPGVPPLDPRIYRRARENYLSLLGNGFMVEEERPGMYPYRVRDGSKEYLGLVACIDTDDYLSNAVKRHELTVHEKERDRTLHIESLDAQEGLVFLVYRNEKGIAGKIERICRESAEELFGVMTRGGTQHRISRIVDPAKIEEIVSFFEGVEHLYIADGHHRAAAAINVALKRGMDGRATEEVNRFMGALLAHDSVTIHGYSRLIADLQGMSEREFLARLREYFDVSEIDGPDLETCEDPRIHQIFLYLKGGWHLLERPFEATRSLIDTLDVVVLQRLVMEEILGINDPRSDPRIQYVSGARGYRELEGLVDAGAYRAAFAIRPLDIETVMAISDAGEIMPPKSTWFEPKLMSGLLVHPFE